MQGLPPLNANKVNMEKILDAFYIMIVRRIRGVSTLLCLTIFFISVQK